MKGIAKPSIYFSAYPLKAAEPETPVSPSESSQSTSPYLRSLLAGKTKEVSRVRVFPMINPYKDPYKGEVKLSPIDRIMRRIPADNSQKQSFRNYE
jgi:hypothetical protein